MPTSRFIRLNLIYKHWWSKQWNFRPKINKIAVLNDQRTRIWRKRLYSFRKNWSKYQSLESKSTSITVPLEIFWQNETFTAKIKIWVKNRSFKVFNAVILKYIVRNCFKSKLPFFRASAIRSYLREFSNFGNLRDCGFGVWMAKTKIRYEKSFATRRPRAALGPLFSHPIFFGF